MHSNKCFLVQLYPKSFTSKPTAPETAKMCHEFITMEMDVEKLRFCLCSGKSCRPAIIDDKTGQFIEQSAFFVDVDNSAEKRTVRENLAICQKNNLYPNIIYRTFSGNALNQRHRLVFVSEKPITDLQKRNYIQTNLVELFGADLKCNNVNRIFYGGNICYFYNPLFFNDFYFAGGTDYENI